MTTLQQIKPLLQQAHKSKKGRKAKAKPIFVSRKIELYYTKQLLLISAACKEASKEIVLPAASQNIGDGWFDAVLNTIKSKLLGVVAQIAAPLATDVVTRQRDAADKQLTEQLQQQTGVDLSSMYRAEDIQQAVDDAIAANVALIKSIPEQYVQKVEALTHKALQEGQSVKDLQDAIKSVGDATDSRARLIAQDQLAKINSRITQVRQQSLGITHYTWHTAHDERVRKEHRAKNGKVYAWDNPPSGGHAGQPIRCRCVAIPYTDHLIDENAPKPEDLV